MKKIRVLVIDDSAMIRKLVTEILSTDEGIEVIGTAADPLIARTKIKELSPDVLTLDVEMPRMDGLTFLSNLMRLRPMPVVMLSTLTAKGTDATLEALNTGAVDFICKPNLNSGQTLEDCAKELIAKVKTAAKANVKGQRQATSLKSSSGSPPTLAHITRSSLSGKIRLIAIGASTGGTEAIRAVLEVLPEFTAPIVIAQHIPKEFSGPFAARMNSLSAMRVKEAEHGEIISPGHVYIAPGSHHLTVEKCGPAKYRCCLDLNDPVNRHRPSVDVMFDSVTKHVGAHSVGVILTGMGKDGAKGLLNLRNSGASTIAQDEASSVVWGMPGESVKIGAAEYTLPLNKVAGKVMTLLTRSSSRDKVLAVGA